MSTPVASAQARIQQASRAGAAALHTWRGLHEAASIVVCGCGPSLRELTIHDDIVTIGVNDVGRLFDPTYLVVVNPRNQFKEDRFRYVESSNAQALFTQLELGRVRPPVVRFKLGRYGGVDIDGDSLHYTQNSPYVAVCLAAYMGARRIGLIGVDFTDDHFFGRTGRHPLVGRLHEIDAQYGRLAAALARRGVELVNLSSISRLASLAKMPHAQFADGCARAVQTTSAAPAANGLQIVSYATTPIAGVPEILARCISSHTAHRATCVWATGDYGNGVRFAGGVQWSRERARAEELIREADVVVVHNGKVLPQHARLLEHKPIVTMAHNYAWNVDRRFVERGLPGVVVGQYQATLPEFAGWQRVPNPLPLRDARFQPEPKQGPVRICYTPSGAHEAYPVGHRLYWHAKGFQTTLRVLDELARLRGIVVEATRGRQISHDESLAMKRRAHIVIDECVTGSYHRNSLEGLAAGCVVVNGVGLVPAIVDVLRDCSGPDAASPFVSTGLGDLRATLMRLIDAGPAALAEQGAANRAWMERHWDFTAQWTRFWEPTLAAAMHGIRYSAAARARTRTPAATSLTPRGPAMSTSTARAIAPASGVSAVIPHGGSDRLPLLSATLAKLRQSPAVREIIIVDMAPERTAEELAKRWRCRYAFVSHHGPFERARALNIGSALAQHALVLWLDNDLLLPASFVDAAVSELNRRGLDYLLPFTTIRYLCREDSEHVVRGEREPQECAAVNTLYSGHHPSNSGAAGLVRRDFIVRFGGLIEGFRGWGGEDNAWNHKVCVLGRFGATQRSDQHIAHLYHPGSGGYAPMQPAAANPHYRDNLALLQQVCSIHDRQRFLERFPPATLPLSAAVDAGGAEPSERTATSTDLPAVWLYWEGPCPPWIRACRRTILRHAPAARMLDGAAFERLRVHDRDIDLKRLHVAHRADFIRAYLLAHYGGLWIDSDCLVMQPLSELLGQLSQHNFVAHRERSGLISNGFIAARPGSEAASAYYRHLCAVLRARKRLGWTTLGSEALGQVLSGAGDRWTELPCERIQPICWSKPESFVRLASDEEHGRSFDAQALCYMLSHTQIAQRKLGEQLLHPNSFFSYLIRRSSGSDGGAGPDYESIFAAMGEQYRRYGDESVSGPGSSLAQTRVLRECLPMLLGHLQVRTLLDAPCGDFNWVRSVNLGIERYIGVDVMSELIVRNQQLHANEQRRFQCADILAGDLPRSDAVLSRDFLVHLSFEEVFRCLATFRNSGAQYLLATTFPRRESNADTRDGAWRTLNLTRAPFGFPPPLHLINEKCTENGGAYADKSLAVWRFSDLPLPR